MGSVAVSLNESPSKKEGKKQTSPSRDHKTTRLNESPSQKEGKSPRLAEDKAELAASMKALPRRKGIFLPERFTSMPASASMKALPRRKGIFLPERFTSMPASASMKALPRRKGNAADFRGRGWHVQGLNESPSKKEGKSPPPLKPKTQPMQGLDESPSQKEGKYEVRTWRAALAAEPQ